MTNTLSLPQNDWIDFFKRALIDPKNSALWDFVENAYATSVCYPPKNQLFEAFVQCSFCDTKVVIMGQDPYHGPNQANGLCFSVNSGERHPPSLRNIFKELEADVSKPYPLSGDLVNWAKQGVLLLNDVLSVSSGLAGSHQKIGWEVFTNDIINHINDNKNGVIFLLWGGYAKKKGLKIDRSKHIVLETGHPSPLSANRGFWFGNKHFSEVNRILENRCDKPINW